jgi:N-acetylglucosamine-6-phosphate deacetylase
MASSNQARLFGWEDRGKIEVGRRADLVLFNIVDGEVKVTKTVLAGEVVYEAK